MWGRGGRGRGERGRSGAMVNACGRMEECEEGWVCDRGEGMANTCSGVIEKCTIGEGGGGEGGGRGGGECSKNDCVQRLDTTPYPREDRGRGHGQPSVEVLLESQIELFRRECGVGFGGGRRWRGVGEARTRGQETGRGTESVGAVKDGHGSKGGSQSLPPSRASEGEGSSSAAYSGNFMHSVFPKHAPQLRPE